MPGKLRPVADGSVPTDTLIRPPSFAYPDLEAALGEFEAGREVFKADASNFFYTIAYGPTTRAASCVAAAAATQGGEVTLLPTGLLMGQGDSPAAACGCSALVAHTTKVLVNATVATMRRLSESAEAPSAAPAAYPPGSLTLAPYVDDFLGGAGQALAAVAWRTLNQVAGMANIRFGTGGDKYVPPTPHSMVALGVRYDATSGTMSLDSDKLASYMLQACVIARALAVPGLRSGVTHLAIATLAGRLEWYARLHPPARMHLATIHAAAHAAAGPAGLHAQLGAQLQVWRDAWQKGGFKPQLMLRPDPARRVITAASDAGDDAVAAVADDASAVWHRLTADERASSSSERELLGMRLGLLPLLSRLPAGCVVHQLCDNGSAASGINRSRSRSSSVSLDTLISDILNAADAAGIHIIASHVPRELALVALCDRLASAPSANAALAHLRDVMGGSARLAEC
jgi:hypothetical protein